MLTNEQILERFKRNFEDCRRVQDMVWRPLEVDENYAVREGRQWIEREKDKVEADGLTAYTINEIAPVVDSITGFQMQNRSEVEYVPRMHNLDEQKAKVYADLVNNGVNHIERKAQVASYDSQAFDDSLICGIGATDTLIDYEHNVNGEAVKERIFPGFLMWDQAARKRNLKDSGWCLRAKIVSTDSLEEEDEESDTTATQTVDDTYFLQYFDTIGNNASLSVVYDYQWRQKEKVYRIKNPFLNEAVLQNEVILNWLGGSPETGTAEKRFGFTLEDRILVMTKKNWQQFKTECEALGLQLAKPLAQDKYKYYRATIWGGKVREKSENYSQSGFSIRFITGKYSETDQCWYGILRAMKPAQRLLNQAITDYQGYLRTSPKGGFFMEADAVDNLPAFKRTLSKARELTVVKKNALKEGKILPKTPAPIPPGLLEMIQLASNTIMRVVGVTPEWMGQFNSKDMTAALQKQMVKQGMTVLAPYYDSFKFYQQDNGYLYIDVLRILAENDPGRLIRNTQGEGDMYLELIEDDIAPDYDIEVLDVPLSENENAEMFQAMNEMAQIYAPTNPLLATALTTESLEFSPLKQDAIERIRKASQPPPPPQPDPVNQELVLSQSKLNIAQAEKAIADALKSKMDSLLKQKELAEPVLVDKPDINTPVELALKAGKLQLEEQDLQLRAAEVASKQHIEAQKLVSEHATKHKKIHADTVIEAARLDSAERSSAKAAKQPKPKKKP